MKKLLLAVLLLASGCKGKGPLAITNTPAPSQNNFYLMLGQSNFSNMPTADIHDPLLKLRGEDALVFNFAFGGSSLSEWQKGQPLYQSALQGYKAMNGKKLAGIFFWQGEHEAVNGPAGDVSTWAQRFTQLVHDLRQDTGNPNLKIVFMQIGTDPSYPYTQAIKDQQASVSLTNVVMARSDDYPTADGQHFFDSYPALAERLVAAMVNQ